MSGEPSDRACLVYSRCRTPGSPLIRHADRWGQWSHCGIVAAANTVIEARAFHGVVQTPVFEFLYRASHTELVEIAVPDIAAGLTWAQQQIGKGYDYRSILGNLLRQSWQDDERWQCAELVEAFLVACGRPRFRASTWRISPNLSWSVL